MGHQEPKGLIRTDRQTRRLFCILHPKSPFHVFAKSRGGITLECVECETQEGRAED